MGEHLVNWIKGAPGIKDQVVKLENNDGAQRFKTAVNGAVLMSAASSLLGFFSGTSAGAQRAIRGRKQVQSLQKEVLNLRDESNDLRKELLQTQNELAHEKKTHEKKDPHHDHPAHSGHDHSAEQHTKREKTWASDIAAQKTEAGTELSL